MFLCISLKINNESWLHWGATLASPFLGSLWSLNSGETHRRAEFIEKQGNRLCRDGADCAQLSLAPLFYPCVTHRKRSGCGLAPALTLWGCCTDGEGRSSHLLHGHSLISFADYLAQPETLIPLPTQPAIQKNKRVQINNVLLWPSFRVFYSEAPLPPLICNGNERIWEVTI